MWTYDEATEPAITFYVDNYCAGDMGRIYGATSADVYADFDAMVYSNTNPAGGISSIVMPAGQYIYMYAGKEFNNGYSAFGRKAAC